MTLEKLGQSKSGVFAVAYQNWKSSRGRLRAETDKSDLGEHCSGLGKSLSDQLTLRSRPDLALVLES